MSEIDFGDPRGFADFATFIGRSRRVSPEGSVRLQVLGSVLVATVAVLEGSGLMGEGTVLGMRIVPVVPGPPLDVTVAFASVADRLARADGRTTTLHVPPTTVQASWAGLTPPRGGWEPVGSLDGGVVDDLAAQGISDVAAGTPEGAGAQAVAALRRRVWGAMTDTVPPVTAGLAFGAHVLGFTRPGEPATVAAHGRWTRVSTSRGHVLAR
ncbi:hypothetical protein N865_21660 [Intrasporangium oryzae NRRL B-24470]|uniref:Uncharacterized protein n=1 Tax=Intrasporangium oryzae NRRL B-24470 TaxID=1386089 RepID=W9G2Y5_9MICO|nr:hypothetical protein [Intrasporangium oryzae]EWS99646.1 hypothetical protein N865_21660 [Intrasporangium oryzae NRRL B-24470]